MNFSYHHLTNIIAEDKEKRDFDEDICNNF